MGVACLLLMSLQIYRAIAQSVDCVLVDFETGGNGIQLQHGNSAHDAWSENYGLTITGLAGSGARIFDTSQAETEGDLGSPNKSCGGPGVGVEGSFGQQGENCIALGNVLVVQSSTSVPPPTISFPTPEPSLSPANAWFQLLRDNTRTRPARPSAGTRTMQPSESPAAIPPAPSNGRSLSGSSKLNRFFNRDNRFVFLYARVPDATDSPTIAPTVSPLTDTPTAAPTGAPTYTPTNFPTHSSSPSLLPSTAPTGSPTGSPTFAPTSVPTGAPTSTPTDVPTLTSSDSPSTESPTGSPTAAPTSAPTGAPTNVPTDVPTLPSSISPSTESLTGSPTTPPTSTPTGGPTNMPTDVPTTQLSSSSSFLAVTENAVPAVLPSPVSKRGGSVVFSFDSPVYFKTLGLFNLAKGVDTLLTLWDGTEFSEIRIQGLGANAVQTVVIERVGIRSLRVNLIGSGAVTFLSFCFPSKSSSEVEEDSDGQPFQITSLQQQRKPIDSSTRTTSTTISNIAENTVQQRMKGRQDTTATKKEGSTNLLESLFHLRSRNKESHQIP